MTTETIDRLYPNHSWITIVFLFCLILLFILKVIQPKLLEAFFGSFFSQGFIKSLVEKHDSYFTPFYMVFFSFSSIIISITILLLVNSSTQEYSFLEFISVLVIVIMYRTILLFLTLGIQNILNIEKNTKFYIHSKTAYTQSFSLLIFPFLILNFYGLNNNYFLVSILAILAFFRATIIFYNNKKLIISQLFYFILYFCTLELAPVLILYKTTPF